MICRNQPGESCSKATWRRCCLVVFFLFLALFYPLISFADELFFPSRQFQAGEEIRLPLVLAKSDNLAGARLVIRYSQEILTLKQVAKTPATQSLLQVVNDKKPGLIIIAMVGAQGIKGSKLELLHLVFQGPPALKQVVTTDIILVEYELLRDDLIEIPVTVKNGRITIIP